MAFREFEHFVKQNLQEKIIFLHLYLLNCFRFRVLVLIWCFGDTVSGWQKDETLLSLLSFLCMVEKQNWKYDEYSKQEIWHRSIKKKQDVETDRRKYEIKNTTIKTTHRVEEHDLYIKLYLTWDNWKWCFNDIIKCVIRNLNTILQC